MNQIHHRTLYVDRTSALHKTAGELKLIGLVAFVIVVSTLNGEHLWAFLTAALVLATTVLSSGLRLGEVAVRCIPATPFMVGAALVPVISDSAEATTAAMTLGGKIMIGVGSSAVFASVTRPSELTSALQRLRVPTVFVAVIGFMFRYLDLMVAEVVRVRVAMVSRAYSPRWLTQARPIASASGAMMMRSFERGERVHAAMVARGFTGEMPVDNERGRAKPATVLLAVFPAIAVLVARVIA